MVDAFYFCVGGAVGEYAQPARQMGYRAAARDVPAADRAHVEWISRPSRNQGEDLRSYFDQHRRRHTPRPVRRRGHPSVERDAPGTLL